MKKLGSEKIWRKFFVAYLEKTIGTITGVIVDSTGLPNEPDFPLSAWRHYGGESEHETRLLIVVERNTGMPLYF